MTLYEQFFKGKEAQLQLYQEMEKNQGISFLSTLAKEKNKTDFIAFITEINIGLQLQPFCSSMKKEPLLNGKRPDWLVTMNGQDVLVEVVRLNASAADQQSMDFDDAVIDAMATIRIGAFIGFDYDDRTLKIETFDLQKCQTEVAAWMQDKRQEGDCLNVQDEMEFTFHKYKPDLAYVCAAGGGKSITFDYRRLHGPKSRLMEKAIKYQSEIAANELPYLIGMHINFHTWFKSEDLYQSLYGSSVSYAGYKGREAPIYSHSLEGALYYADKFPLKDVSGILLLADGTNHYFHNYSVDNKLSAANAATLLKWQYPYESL